MNTKRSILIIEDEAVVGLMMSRYAHRLGYNPLDVVDDPEEAMRLVTVFKPDIVCMDIKLPGAVDGIELAGRIQQYHQEFSLIYITGLVNRSTFQRAREQTGFSDFLLKPVSMFRMKEALAKANQTLSPSISASDPAYPRSTGS
jgi:CheY-like chemotaxis protein